jgi:hypothetical protein
MKNKFKEVYETQKPHSNHSRPNHGHHYRRLTVSARLAMMRSFIRGVVLREGRRGSKNFLKYF